PPLQAMPLERQLRPSDHRLPNILGQQAFCLAALGEFEEAVVRGSEAVTIAEAPGFRARSLGLVVALFGLGVAYLTRGEAAHAAALLERGRTVALERDVGLALGATSSALGLAHALQGRDREGVALIEEGVAQWGATFHVANTVRHRWLAEAHLLGGRPDDARRAVEEALGLARRYGEPGNEAEALRVLGECAAAGEPADPTAARESFEQALALAGVLEMRPLVAHCHFGLGKLYRRARARTTKPASTSPPR